MRTHHQRLLAATLLTAILAACSSTPVDKGVPVEEKTGTPPQASTGANTGAVEPPPIPVVRPETDELANPNGYLSQNRIVYFDYDSFAIREEYATMVKRHADYLVKNKTRKVFVEGHTDLRGSREYNLSLGQKRAETVKSALKLSGVPEDRLEAVSYGKEKPADTAQTEAGFAKNRRAEINYRLQ